MAEWLGSGLQNHLQRFESARRLNKKAVSIRNRFLFYWIYVFYPFFIFLVNLVSVRITCGDHTRLEIWAQEKLGQMTFSVRQKRLVEGANDFFFLPLPLPFSSGLRSFPFAFFPLLDQIARKGLAG